MRIRVEVLTYDQKVIASYTMEHDDEQQRRVLGEQCRNAFEAGQIVCTAPTDTVWRATQHATTA